MLAKVPPVRSACSRRAAARYGVALDSKCQIGSDPAGPLDLKSIWDKKLERVGLITQLGTV